MLKLIFLLLTIIIQTVQADEFNFNNNVNKGSTSNKFFSKSKVVSAEQAFKFVARKINNVTTIDITIAPNCYLYKNKLQLVNATNQQKIVVNYPLAKLKSDEFSQRNIEIYDTSFAIELTDNNIKSIIINYQGCYANTLCYPPQSIIIDISQEDVNNKPVMKSQSVIQNVENKFSNILTTSSFIVSLLVFFLAGIALCFTPCVFPMLPIICSLVINNSKATRLQALNLASLYIIGMSLVMAVMGVITALLGSSFNLQLHMQSPWLLIPIAILFIILAVAMFGVYEIKLPAKLQQKLAIQQKNSNKYIYAFFMGVIAALVVSPCVTPPLVGALVYISTTSDIILGGCCLFALGLGMGLPMLIISIGGKSLLPKSGLWMLAVRIFFAIALMIVADMLLSRILLVPIIYLIHIFITILVIILLYKCLLPYLSQKTAKLLRVVNYLTVCAGVIISLIITFQLMATNNIQITANTFDTNSKKITLTSPAELTKNLNKFKKQQLPVMLFINAKWCSLCHKMETEFMNNAEVVSLIDNLGYINFDITKLTTEQHSLLKSLNIFGPPAILFFDKNGNELANLRIKHAVTAEDIANRIKNTLKLN